MTLLNRGGRPCAVLRCPGARSCLFNRSTRRMTETKSLLHAHLVRSQLAPLLATTLSRILIKSSGREPQEAGHHIGVELSCIGNCLFSFYLERHHLMVEGYFNGKFRQQALAIAERVQDFYERWQTTPSINGQ